MKRGRVRSLASWLATFLSVLAFSSALAADYGPLLTSLRTDPSFKVRLQAVRVVVKGHQRGSSKPTSEVLAALATAAQTDENELVRGLATRALAELGGPAQLPVLRAIKTGDASDFVRSQADKAVAELEAAVRATPVLVLRADPWSPTPGSDLTSELESALARATNLADGRFRVGPQASGRGYLLRASVARLDHAPIEDGRELVSLELRVAVATWPEENLRQVVTTRASARVPVAVGRQARVRRRLLDDAVQRAVADALVEIEGG